jgi:Cupin
MSDSGQDALRRKLNFYRFVIATAALIWVGVFLANRVSKGSVLVVDLNDELLRLSKNPNVTDLARTFYSSAAASVHFHVMGRTQRCPLHIHPTHGELTAIVGGPALVSHLFPAGGSMSRTEGTYTTGDLIYSPAFCGHEWVNPSSDRLLGNVVFAAPPFAGNLYVREDDPRLNQGHPPSILRVSLALDAFNRSTETVSDGSIGSLTRQIHLVTTTREYALTPASGTVLFVRAGRGVLRAEGRSATIAAGFLAVLTDHRAAKVETVGSDPLLLVVFNAD